MFLLCVDLMTRMEITKFSDTSCMFRIITKLNSLRVYCYKEHAQIMEEKQKIKHTCDNQNLI